MHKLSTRYLYKLATNLIGAILSSVAIWIIPRGLGPERYGDFNFLTNFFTSFIFAIDVGSSTWFYVRLSQRPEQRGLIKYYSSILIITGSVIMIFICGVFFVGQENNFWPHQEKKYVVFAAIYAFILFISGIFEKVSDAFGLTVYSEVIKIFQKLTGTIFLLLLFYFSLINLHTIFIYHWLLITLLIIVLFITIAKKTSPISSSGDLDFKNNFKNMLTYIVPLISLNIVGFVSNYFDRWMLQLFGGSQQQGFYSLAFSTSAICFIFTGSLTPLLMREYSIHASIKDYDGLAKLFKKNIPLLYTVAAFISCFLSCHSDSIVKFVGGEKYIDAIPCMAILMLYPIHQTYGQLSSSLFLSTGMTKMYRNLGIVNMAIGTILTYVMLAPHEIFGLSMGHIGLAIKTILIQFLGVNIHLYFNTKLLKLRYRKFLAHQFYIVIGFFLIASSTKKIVTSLLPANNFIIFFISGILYTLAVFVLIKLSAKCLKRTNEEITQLNELLSIDSVRFFLNK